eukprot:4076930-Pyramimonas_sp.AAC.1
MADSMLYSLYHPKVLLRVSRTGVLLDGVGEGGDEVLADEPREDGGQHVVQPAQRRPVDLQRQRTHLHVLRRQAQARLPPAPTATVNGVSGLLLRRRRSMGSVE